MSERRPPVAILGAGLAGLLAARELRRRGVAVEVYEAGKRIAGLAQSFRDEEGFTYDFGAHFITNRLAAALGIGAQCRDVRKYGEAVRLGAKTYSYPFGLIRSPRFVASAISGRLTGSGRGEPPSSAAEWFRAAYGERLAAEVAIPLVEAWSGAPASELAPSVIPPQVDRGTGHVLGLKLASRLSHRAVANGYCRTQPESPSVWHVYPGGGLGFLCDRLAADLEGVVHLESPVEAILVEGQRAVGIRVQGRDVEASAVVSTAPVHLLAKLVRGTDALQHLARFRYRPLILVNLRFSGAGLLSDVVTWIPERRFPFFRLTEAPRAMPWLAPAGKTVLTVDIGCEVGDPTWRLADEAVGAMCLDHLAELIPGARQRYLGCRVMRTPIAHPVFLREYEAERLALEHATPVAGLYSIGRNGEFAHILMEDVYWRTLARVREVLAFLSTPAPLALSGSVVA
ncbi:MAG TPA: FAD-dependent oxidoreductase [Gemmatimonadales bacterium]|jgi:protoporphyrinogen/coproporphyrinogen III oxidase|nr:FAD-dependent oxidoreductase [Gemmatimonadales bacterium]